MGLLLSGGLRDNFANLSPAHRQRKKKEPKKPEKTAEEEALAKRQRLLLDKEIEESEEKFAALARGKLGRQSLLSGAPRTAAEARSGRRSGGSSSAGSLLSGRGGGSTGVVGGNSSRGMSVSTGSRR